MHSHQVSVQNNLLDDLGQRVQLVNVPLITVETYRPGNPLYLEAGGMHTHIVNGVTGSPLGSTPGTHSYTLTGSTDAAGNTANIASTPYQARGGPAYGYVDGLLVQLDGNDITGLIVGKLGWGKLGDGSSGHSFVTSGTGSIDLLELGVAVGIGPHTLEFGVPSGGGKVIYNLYVE
jgi:hypothetical protein